MNLSVRVLKFLSILSVAGILLLSFFSWYSCDDFCYRNELSQHSVLEMAWLKYMTWDGRSISLAAFVQLFSLKYLTVEMTVFLWAASFIGTALLILKIVEVENPGFSIKSHYLTGVAIISSVMWMGMWKLIPDIIYWSTGGSYSLLNLLGFLWLYFFLRWLKDLQFNAGRNIPVFFISLICGVNSHNFVTALLLLCILEWWRQKFVVRNRLAVFYCLIALAGLTAGACIVFFAPGNNVRLSVISYNGFSSKFVYFYFLVLARYMYWLFALILFCFLVLWLSGTESFSVRNFFSRIKEARNQVRQRHGVFSLLYHHKYLLAALSTILVFTATSFFAVPRTGIFFATFLILYVFQHAWKTEINFVSKKFVYGSISSLSVLVCLLFFQMQYASSVKHQLMERVKLYEQNKGADVVVEAIPAEKIPFAFSFTDVSSDPNYWVNGCVAQHYELKSVRSASR